MKNKKIIILVIILVILVGLTLLFIKKEKNKKNPANSNNTINTEEQNTNQNTNPQNEYDQEIKKLYEIETNNKPEETIVTIIDKEEKAGETIKITDKDIKYIEILSSTKGEAKQKAIENKIYAKEAVKMGITLSPDTIKEIEKLANSDEIINSISGEETSKANYKKRLYTYYTEINYKKELKDKILYEIDNNNISIKNENIKTKTKEYHNTKNSFKENKNPTDEERQAYLSKIGNLYFEIQNLYLEAIKDKYTVEIKE